MFSFEETVNSWQDCLLRIEIHSLSCHSTVFVAVKAVFELHGSLSASMDVLLYHSALALLRF